MTEAISSELIQNWARTALAALGEARVEIDTLNVFPVPDGDTGTNMYLTMEAAEAAMREAADELAQAPADEQSEVNSLAVLSATLAHGALMGARGNSGVILSQILRGMVRVDLLPDGSQLDAASAIRAGLAQATELAYAAVGEPKVGTMLTVIRCAAESAAAEKAPDLASVVQAAAEGASEALRRTPDLLPVLAEAGVVDSGGRGIVVILDALAEVVTGVRRPSPPPKTRLTPKASTASDAAHDYDGPKYEVMYLLRADDDRLPGLRSRLAELGDSLVVVGGDSLWNVHVHVDEAGEAIEAAIAVGQPFRIRVTWLAETGTPEKHNPQQDRRSIICVAHGRGVVNLLEETGVIPIYCEPKVAPATGEILAAITQDAAAEAIILPSDKNARSAAEAAVDAAHQQGFRVSIVPTSSIVESLAAIAVHDPDQRFDEDVVSMSRAAGATRYGGVTVSSREAMTSAGTCSPGDILGMVDGDILQIGDDPVAVSRSVLQLMMAAGSELVTIVTGAEADAGQVSTVVGQVERDSPGVEVVVYEGGQPFWPMIFGVE